MRVYTKEFLVEAFLSRYIGLEDVEQFSRLEEMANSFYDKVGKDSFRVYCALDAQALKVFKEDFDSKLF